MTTIKEDFKWFISNRKDLEIKEELLKERILKEILPDWFDYNGWERYPNNLSPDFFNNIYIHRIDEHNIYLDSCDRFESEIPTSFFLNRETWDAEKKLREKIKMEEKLAEERQIRERELRALKTLLDRHPDAYYWDEKDLRIKSKLN